MRKLFIIPLTFILLGLTPIKTTDVKDIQSIINQNNDEISGWKNHFVSKKIDTDNLQVKTGIIDFNVNGGYYTKKITNPGGNTNNGIKFAPASLVYITWNNNLGYALVLVKEGTGTNETPIVIISSNADGGNSEFNTQNAFGSGTGISAFSTIGTFYIQTKTEYTGGDIYLTIIGYGGKQF